MMYVHNVIQEGEDDINSSLSNYIFTILNEIFNFFLIMSSATHLKNLRMHVCALTVHI